MGEHSGSGKVFLQGRATRILTNADHHPKKTSLRRLGEKKKNLTETALNKKSNEGAVNLEHYLEKRICHSASAAKDLMIQHSKPCMQDLKKTSEKKVIQRLN